MLVLVSFGLVLLATILLVVGLLSDDGLTLIYLSIAASATAAVVLYVAFRRTRVKGDAVTSEGPAPLADDIAPQPLDEPTTPIPAGVAAGAPAATAVQSAAPAREPEPAPEPVPASEDVDDDWMADADWEDGEVDFPIADYDDLTVAEIMPLLPQLYSDELDDVIARERAGKNRTTILQRLEELKVVGTDADAEEVAAEPDTLDEPSSLPEPEPAAAPEAADQPAPAPLTARRSGASLLDVDDEDDEVLFPIADYDNLSVAQIVPLLSQLEADELAEVRAREVNGANRRTLLTEIDSLLPGRSVPDPEPAAAESAPKAAPKAAAKKRATKKRATKKRATKKRATKKAATKRKSAKKTSTKKAASAGGKKKAKATRFPIANYDELNVADIRPRLSDLSDNQLRQVRERESAGAGRKTILDEIDRRLS